MIKNIWQLNLIQMMIYPLKYQFYNMIIVVRSVFHKDNKYYPQVFRGIFK